VAIYIPVRPQRANPSPGHSHAQHNTWVNGYKLGWIGCRQPTRKWRGVARWTNRRHPWKSSGHTAWVERVALLNFILISNIVFDSFYFRCKVWDGWEKYKI